MADAGGDPCACGARAALMIRKEYNRINAMASQL